MTNTEGDTLCPVCGFDLETEAWLYDSPTNEFCPSCGIQFGYDDGIFAMDREAGRKFHEQWRADWVKDAMPWRKTGGRQPPRGWNPAAQLRNLLERNAAAKEGGG